jgi:hypothetical protein
MPKPIEEPSIIEIKATSPSISPIFSNTYSVSAQEDIVIIDFGFISRAYTSPHDLEDKQIASICLPWDDLKYLSNTLREVLSEHKKELATKSTKTNK